MNPNSEIIFSFNTMTAKNRKGGTQLVLRNAENNQEIASTDIQEAAYIVYSSYLITYIG